MAESSGGSGEDRWRIELLGGLRATHDDQVITHFRTQKNTALLAYLAYYRRRSRRREELIELLWPEGWRRGRQPSGISLMASWVSATPASSGCHRCWRSAPPAPGGSPRCHSRRGPDPRRR